MKRRDWRNWKLDFSDDIFNDRSIDFTSEREKGRAQLCKNDHFD